MTFTLDEMPAAITPRGVRETLEELVALSPIKNRLQLKAANGNFPKRLGECLGDLSTIDMKESQTSRANQLNPPKTQSPGWQSS